MRSAGARIYDVAQQAPRVRGAHVDARRDRPLRRRTAGGASRTGWSRSENHRRGAPSLERPHCIARTRAHRAALGPTPHPADAAKASESTPSAQRRTHSQSCRRASARRRRRRKGQPCPPHRRPRAASSSRRPRRRSPHQRSGSGPQASQRRVESQGRVLPRLAGADGSHGGEQCQPEGRGPGPSETMQRRSRSFGHHEGRT